MVYLNDCMRLQIRMITTSYHGATSRIVKAHCVCFLFKVIENCGFNIAHNGLPTANQTLVQKSEVAWLKTRVDQLEIANLRLHSQLQISESSLLRPTRAAKSGAS